MTPHIVIIRVHSSDEGTWGVLAIDGYACYTIELPWKDNTPWISCIPEGEYIARLDLGTKMGGVGVVRILDGQVADRDGILIHVANFAGDITKGYEAEVQGCIGVGTGYYTDPQKKVYPSKPAMKNIIEHIKNTVNDKAFLVKITSMQSVISKGWGMA